MGLSWTVRRKESPSTVEKMEFTTRLMDSSPEMCLAKLGLDEAEVGLDEAAVAVADLLAVVEPW